MKHCVYCVYNNLYSYYHYYYKKHIFMYMFIYIHIYKYIYMHMYVPCIEKVVAALELLSLETREELKACGLGSERREGSQHPPPPKKNMFIPKVLATILLTAVYSKHPTHGRRVNDSLMRRRRLRTGGGTVGK